MKYNAYIGIDLGTSGCRAIAITDAGDVIGQSQQNITPANQAPTHSEQDPQQQWLTVVSVLSDLFSKLTDYIVVRIAVDATSGSVLLADEDGTALTPILMYNDARAVSESKQIEKIAPEESGAHGASSGLAKLIHLQRQYDLTNKFKLLHQSDWINFQLGAEFAVTDYNNALKTGYDVVNSCWPEWLSKLVSESVLPKVVNPGKIIGQLSAKLCKQLRLKNRPNIVAGTTDSIAAVLATGINKSGQAVSSLGSTLVLKLLSDQPIFKPDHGIYSHRLGNKWLVGGASNSGGAVLRHFFSDQQLNNLSLEIDLNKIPADYYPLLQPGERFPEYNAELEPRLSPRPDQDSEFLHGLLSGIANIETKGYQLLQQFGANKLNTIYSVGGGANNRIWQTIREQSLAATFIKPKYTEAAYGSALLARDQLQQY
jgi:sugar (pentulose or hexulose) kinase